ncbi:ATP-binding protein [Paenibacillus aceris]|uniref:histidine kinase n=1 Tax=Paenibacillus aceris TaxID=869555 RepID=A0ABS4HX14_9BACL|nr:ATP-binding protein [Paenibacillus aceris]MBP1963098.1 two-component system sporulation sensor kinase B [Paenibacillus aceris]NHW38782.1 GHKL domain-containing protein [Paenibacillus aceris]
MLGIDQLVLNFLFILVSILTYFSLGLYKTKKKEILIGVHGSISVIFCMSFPFTVFPGYIYDLRILPFIIAILYGGVRPGLFVALVLLLYRYLLGGNGFIVTCISYIPIFIFTAIFLRYYNGLSKKKTITFGTILALCSALFVTMGSIIKSDDIILQNLGFFVFYCIVLVACSWSALYIIETMKDNVKMRDEIHRSEKLNVLGELAATIAHEIRNPLTVSKGFIQLIKSRSTNDTDLNYSTLALEEIDRAESIISEYLMYAKPQADKYEKVNVKEHLYTVLKIIEPYTTSQGHIINHNFEDALCIIADAKKFTQVMINLVKNAVEAMEQDGQLTINVYASNNNVVIEVIDTGVGMSEDQLSRLGVPFYSTKDKGTGLGLMVCYRIIEALDGKIQVKSTKGIGTKFSVIIPKALENE